MKFKNSTLYKINNIYINSRRNCDHKKSTAGTCADKKYTFVIKANSNAALTAGSATVTMPLQKILLQLVLIQLSL